jgi:diguanylate cyclase (GGDEF)-like protein
MAVRFGRTHVQGHDEEPLSTCELCGALPGSSLCEPLLVGGEVIGSVLVSSPCTATGEERTRIRQTVAQAAPVLGNLRNLALAERRAATDSLTGLPNRRGLDDTLKLMVAQAARTVSPLAVVLLDLDQFKRVNDLFGHDRGDEILAAVGVALRGSVRESDFVGRYGGEEFLLLLPATDIDGALRVAELVRAAIATVRVEGVDRSVTASAGVAQFPGDGGDPVSIVRAADRALYAAKRGGRDRVHVASDAGPIDTSHDGVAGTPVEG